MSEPKREGFYHVRHWIHGNNWTIAEYRGDKWWILADESPYITENFEQIGERIERESGWVSVPLPALPEV